MKQFITIILCLLAINCSAQSIINTSGNTATLAGNTYSYSIGEMCAVHTATSATLIVTQGLLQPTTEGPTAIENTWLASDNVRVYPNPSNAIIHLELNTNEVADAKFVLLDISGKNIITQKAILTSGLNKYEFDLSQVANAYYVLQVQLSKKDKNYSTSFKIQKVK